jgi:tetratricopeptide (TPR) repeat protein
MSLAGDFERGLSILRKSFTLNPYYPRWLHHAFFLHHLQNSEYEQALREALSFNMQGFFYSYIDQAVAYATVGRRDLAQRAIDKLLELNPDFVNRPRFYVGQFVLFDDLLERMMDTLHEGGLPG